MRVSLVTIICRVCKEFGQHKVQFMLCLYAYWWCSLMKISFFEMHIWVNHRSHLCLQRQKLAKKLQWLAHLLEDLGIVDGL